MTERVRRIAVGMIVKTGRQDATKNVRIYGTISAASALPPSSPPPTRHSRIALPCPFSPPAQIFFSTFPYRRRFAKRTSVLTSSPRLVVARLRTLFSPLHVLFRHPHLIAPFRSEGGPHHTAGAHSGARSPPPPRAPL